REPPQRESTNLAPPRCANFGPLAEERGGALKLRNERMCQIRIRFTRVVQAALNKILLCFGRKRAFHYSAWRARWTACATGIRLTAPASTSDKRRSISTPQAFSTSSCARKLART